MLLSERRIDLTGKYVQWQNYMRASECRLQGPEFGFGEFDRAVK